MQFFSLWSYVNYTNNSVSQPFVFMNQLKTLLKCNSWLAIQNVHFSQVPKWYRYCRSCTNILISKSLWDTIKNWNQITLNPSTVFQFKYLEYAYSYFIPTLLLFNNLHFNFSFILVILKKERKKKLPKVGNLLDNSCKINGKWTKKSAST